MATLEFLSRVVLLGCAFGFGWTMGKNAFELMASACDKFGCWLVNRKRGSVSPRAPTYWTFKT